MVEQTRLATLPIRMCEQELGIRLRANQRMMFMKMWNSNNCDIDTYKRGSGSTFMIWAYAVFKAIMCPGIAISIGAPIFRIAKIEYGNARTRFPKVKFTIKESPNECQARFDNGSLIESIPYEIKNICGRRYSSILIDEAQVLDDAVFQRVVKPQLNIHIYKNSPPEIHKFFNWGDAWHDEYVVFPDYIGSTK